ncbi:MAG: acyltransferase family protein [Spirosomataceae bacterium]
MKQTSLLDGVIQNGQISSVQMLRGLACLAVFFVHFFSEKNELPANNPLVIASNYGYLGVHVFFVISGFIIPYSMYQNAYKIQHFMQLWGRRMVRIELPYVVSIALVVILKYVGNWLYQRGQPLELDWNTVLLNIGYLNVFFGKEFVNHAYWTLFVELQFYLYIGLVFPLLIHKNILVRNFSYVPFLALNYFWVGGLLLHSNLPIFILGIFAFQFCVGVIKQTEMLVSMIICVLLTLYWQHQVLHLPEAYPIMYASIFAVIFIFAARFKSKVLNFLGKISFSMYLIHVPVSVFIIPLFINHIHNPTYLIIYRFLVLGVVIGASYLFYLLVEKPAIILSKKFKMRSKEVSHNVDKITT